MFSFACKLAINAQGKKKYIGGSAYTLQAVIQLLRIDKDPYDLYVDDELVLENGISMLLQINNGKYMGGGMCSNPFGMVNDGLAELLFTNRIVPNKERPTEFASILSGQHVHREKTFSVHRGKTFRVVNKKPADENGNK